MRGLLSLTMAGALLASGPARAASPGITSNSATGGFALTAQEGYLNQPDGKSVYSWGYGCVANSTPQFKPTMPNQACGTMQVPGPTLIVTEGQPVTVSLTNNLPVPAGNTSILFPDFVVTTSCAQAPAAGVQGLLTCEAAPGSTVTYTFTATTPGTHAYYSGTQGDLQIEMGLYGAVIVLPKTPPAVCTAGLPETNPGGNAKAQGFWKETDFRLGKAAYDHPGSCYDREYLFQFAEIDLNIHQTALEQVLAKVSVLKVPTEPYHPNYYVINGRSAPDLMDPNFDSVYPHQPYNGNPHVHPGEQVLLRVIGQGRWQHTFHEHGNHTRILGRDGNLIKSVSDNWPADPAKAFLAGPVLFTTTTTPGQAFDGIFYFTGRGLNWDPYGHHPGSSNPAAKLPCTPDVNGYNTLETPGAPSGTTGPYAINYFEWCQDHNKPMQALPFGDVPRGGPVTLPDPNYFTNGPFFSGSPYLGPDATVRATDPLSVFLPTDNQANPGNERGWVYMWHSHNEREITTNDVFPGGMMMMLFVDSREFVIDESL